VQPQRRRPVPRIRHSRLKAEIRAYVEGAGERWAERIERERRVTKTASNAATDAGGSWSGASAPISSAT
jgi:hypothetical protein